MITKGQFIRIDYTGRLDDGTVFDTTRADVAEKAGLAGSTHGPVTLCVGEGMVLRGLDRALEGKAGGSFTVTIPAEEGFGKKDGKRLRVVPTMQLVKQGVRAQPGMRLSIDGEHGVVKTTGGGRTVVDFNHPLAGARLTYDVTVLGIVDDLASQVRALLVPLGIPIEEVTAQGESATVKLPAMLPQPILDAIQRKIVSLTSVRTVSFESGTPPAKKAMKETKAAHKGAGEKDQ